jgi:hypothetical protein
LIRELDVLLDLFSGVSPFRPLDIFNVNLSSAGSLAGLIVTYIIVLLQFKTGDQ